MTFEVYGRVYYKPINSISLISYATHPDELNIYAQQVYANTEHYIKAELSYSPTMMCAPPFAE